MLALLALNFDRALSRDELIEAIWPDDNPELARGSLRTALHSLRRLLNTSEDCPAIGSDWRYVWLEADRVQTDHRRFLELVAEPGQVESDAEVCHRLRLALEEVRAPLLMNFEESWLVPHKLAMDEIYTQSAIRLMGALFRLGELNGAIEVGRSALRVAPNREDIHVELIRLLARSGRGSEAIRQYEALEQWLDETWGEQPSEEAQQALNAAEPVPRQFAAGSTEVGGSEPELIGRSEELQALSDLLRREGSGSVRLVTLKGFGGIGKTVLALAALHVLNDDIPTVFVELQRLRHGSQILRETAEAAGLTGGFGDPVDRLAEVFANNPVIITFDNAEHLVVELVDVIPRLLERLPHAKVLVTSRVALGLSQEQVFSVSLLSVPLPHAPFRVLEKNASVALFCRRARAVEPAFCLTTMNAGAAAELCRRLEGLPLAIEIAASQITALTPQQILLRMESGRQLLVAGAKKGSERHRSLDRVAESSYGLLSEDLQKDLRSLAYPRNHMSLEAARALCDDEDPLPRLTELIRSSLLQRQQVEDAIRFFMLAPMRSFALDKLTVSQERPSVRERHRRYYCDLAARLRWEFEGASFGIALDVAEVEHDHFRQVADECAADGAAMSDVVLLVHSLMAFLVARGHHFEWVDRLGRLLGAHGSSLSVADHTLARSALGSLLVYCNRLEEARLVLRDEVRHFDACRRPVDRAGIRNAYALSLISGHSEGAERRATEALVLLDEVLQLISGESERSLWDPFCLSVSRRSNLAATLRLLDRHGEAIDELRAALSTARSLDFSRMIGPILLGIADNYLDLGQHQEALPYAREAVLEGERSGTRWVVMGGHHAVATCSARAGDVGKAVDVLRPCLIACLEAGFADSAAQVLNITVGLLADCGHVDAAQELLLVARRLGRGRHLAPNTWKPNVPVDWFETEVIAAPLTCQDPEVLAAFDAAVGVVASKGAR
ncbi:MAG: hypothetical protein HONBIEJF_00201 [Fimbriimonadaceae bacterium]|nr:hypothetical protein [Fimbriimonadaceae bacterium]